MRSDSVFSSRVRLACAAALAAMVLGCGNGTAAPDGNPTSNLNGGIAAGTLEVTAANRSLTLRNTTEQVVTYFVFEKETLTRATFPPCGSQITRLTQGDQNVVPYSEIVGYSDKATEAAVFWCALTRSADGTFKPLGTMQSKMIRL
jgi:hypothetical protein